MMSSSPLSLCSAFAKNDRAGQAGPDWDQIRQQLAAGAASKVKAQLQKSESKEMPLDYVSHKAPKRVQ